jgi:hypothetical protein
VATTGGTRHELGRGQLLNIHRFIVARAYRCGPWLASWIVSVA